MEEEINHDDKEVRVIVRVVGSTDWLALGYQLISAASPDVSMVSIRLVLLLFSTWILNTT